MTISYFLLLLQFSQDLALGTKQIMSDQYLNVLNTNHRLNNASDTNNQILATAAAVTAISIPPPEAMQALVDQINVVALDPEDVQVYNEDASAGLKTAQETRNTSQDAQ